MGKLTKEQLKAEFSGFLKAKRIIDEAVLNRIEVLEERRGDELAIAVREAQIAILEDVHNYIRHFVLYKVEE